LKLNRIEAASLSKLFAATVMRDFAKHARSPQVAGIISNSRTISETAPEISVGSAFELAFSLLRRSQFRCDYVYRSALVQKLLLGRHTLSTATLLNEVRTGTAVADLTILNGTSTAYEIKSDRDSLKRLDHQVRNYRKVFATVNVIVNQSRVSETINRTPPDVGVLTLSDKFTIQTIRQPIDSPHRTDPIAILDILRANEAITILERLDRHIPAVPNTQIRSELHRAFSTLDPAAVHDQMVNVLKKSRSQAHLRDFVSSIPNSARAAALVSNPSPDSQERIKLALNTPLTEALAWK